MGGFEPPIYSLGGCRLIQARPRALFAFSRIIITYINLSRLATGDVFATAWQIQRPASLHGSCRASLGGWDSPMTVLWQYYGSPGRVLKTYLGGPLSGNA